jgi:hypothetical protein
LASDIFKLLIGYAARGKTIASPAQWATLPLSVADYHSALRPIVGRGSARILGANLKRTLIE